MRSFSKEQERGPVLPPVEVSPGRLRVMEAALRLFARQGFHGTSTRDLTSALEMQPSALYAHFQSKEDVLVALGELGYGAHQRAMRAALLEAGSEPVAQLASFVRANARFHATYPLLAVVVHEELHAVGPDRLAVISLLRQQSAAMLIEVLERGRQLGRLKLGHVTTAAAAIAAMALRIPYWFVPTRAFGIEEMVEAQVELVLNLVPAPRRTERGRRSPARAQRA